MAKKNVTIYQHRDINGNPVANLTPESAVYDKDGKRLDYKLAGMDIDKIKEAKDEALESIAAAEESMTKNIGLDTYPVFSDTKSYVKGEIVNYGGLLYEFTADHEAGAWIGTDARETSLRGEVTKLAESTADIGMLNCDNMLKRDEFTHATVISNGVTFQYLGQGRYHVYGTATEDVSNTIYLDRNKLPDSIVPGKTYQLIYSAKNALFIVWIYAGGEFKTGGMVNENYTFTPPKDADGPYIGYKGT